jgi:hypothetical protein
MNNKELLELAAKAAGNSLAWSDFGPYIPKAPPFDTSGDLWDPLTDDSDALRLAVKLGLAIHVWGDETVVMNCYNDNEIKCIEAHGKDPYAATRRAIVRAAAEIGKEMK